MVCAQLTQAWRKRRAGSRERCEHWAPPATPSSFLTSWNPLGVSYTGTLRADCRGQRSRQPLVACPDDLFKDICWRQRQGLSWIGQWLPPPGIWGLPAKAPCVHAGPRPGSNPQNHHCCENHPGGSCVWPAASNPAGQRGSSVCNLGALCSWTCVELPGHWGVGLALARAVSPPPTPSTVSQPPRVSWVYAFCAWTAVVENWDVEKAGSSGDSSRARGDAEQRNTDQVRNTDLAGNADRVWKPQQSRGAQTRWGGQGKEFGSQRGAQALGEQSKVGSGPGANAE